MTKTAKRSARLGQETRPDRLGLAGLRAASPDRHPSIAPALATAMSSVNEQLQAAMAQLAQSDEAPPLAPSKLGTKQHWVRPSLSEPIVHGSLLSPSELS